MEDVIIILRLAWRNVVRNKRRTVLTLLTVTIGSGTIILINSILKGTHDGLIEDTLSINTGYIQIHKLRFWDNQNIDHAFKPGPLLLKAITSEPGISDYSIRINATGILLYKGNTANAIIQGIDPDNEVRVSNLHKKILPGGRYFGKKDKKHIIIGEIMADKLGISVGDTVSLLSQGYDRTIVAERLTILGIFRSKNPEIDKYYVLIPISQADLIFSMMGNINSIVLKLVDPIYTEDVQNRLRVITSGRELEVLSWKEMVPTLYQSILMDIMYSYLFDFILFMVVVFSIFSTLQFSIFERIREIGIMLSIGTSSGRVAKMLLTEISIILIGGEVMGIIIGYLISYYFKLNPLDFSTLTQDIAVWGVTMTKISADTSIMNILVTFSILSILSILFSVPLAIKTSMLKPVEALRQLK